MKRTILSLLLFGITSIFIFGCSDSGGDGDRGSSFTPTTDFTPTTEGNLDTLVGTYDVYFLEPHYEIPSGGIVISNNCQRNADEYNNYNSHCQNVDVIGKAIIKKETGGKFRLITKIQLSQSAPLDTGDYLEQTYTYADYGAVEPTYFEYIKKDEKGNEVINETRIHLNFTDVTGRTLTKEFNDRLSSILYSRSISNVQIRDEHSINIFDPYQRNLGYGRIIAYKNSDIPIELDKNTPYTPMNGFKQEADPAETIGQ